MPSPTVQKAPKAPDILGYEDYRAFLRDYFAHRKTLGRGFSLATFAAKAGFKARDFILRVMQGTRNLSPDSIEKVAAALDLDERRSSYFDALVRLNQARKPGEKEKWRHRLEVIGRHGKMQRLRRDQFEYLSEWYHAALRSLLPVTYYQDDHAAMARRLDPEISPRQARESVELLLRLGLLERSELGKYRTGPETLTTGDELRSAALARFHGETMELAKRSIREHDPKERDISGITVSVSEKMFSRFKGEIQAFRKRLLAMAAEDKGEDRVVQLNMHLFPLSRIGGPGR